MDYINIRQELQKGNIAKVFPSLRQSVETLGNWELSQEVENLWMTYQQMLSFMLNGIKDPQAEKMRMGIADKLKMCADRMERMERLNTHKEEKYVSIRRGLKNVQSLEEIVSHLEAVSIELEEVRGDELLRPSIKEHKLEELMHSHEEWLLTLFNWTWTSDIWQSIDADQANRIMFSERIKESDKCVFVSAVTLAMMEFYDARKMTFLLDSYLLQETAVAQRAIVGAVLMMYLYHEEMKNDESIWQRLIMYSEDEEFVHELYSTMMQLQLSSTTDTVSERMRNDIMPTIMMGKIMKDNPSDSIKDHLKALGELTKNGENPEWLNPDNISESKVERMINEMAELQTSGSDIHFCTFASAKGYPFFRDVAHWFYPFSMKEPMVADVDKLMKSSISKIMSLMLQERAFCNSDRYSFVYMFQSMGITGNMLEEQVMSQLHDVENLDEVLEQRAKQEVSKADVRRHYIFDLYRFYYSFPYHVQFSNPFAKLKEKAVTPLSNACLGLYTNNAEMERYADFLMRKEFYDAALSLFSHINPNEVEPKNASVWQKIGFCHQKLKHNDLAIHAYNIADILKPDSKWTLTHLASLAMSEGMHDEAVKYYNNLLEIEPENKKYLIGLAKALTDSNKNGEAIQILYKLIYLEKASTKEKLLLAWCLILEGQNDKASKYIDEVAGKEADNSTATLLRSIILLTEGNVRDAHTLLSIKKRKNAEPLHDLDEMLAAMVEHQKLERTQAQLFTDALTLLT